MEKLIRQEIEELMATGKLEETKLYMQHGNTTVYDHSVHVAEMAVDLAQHFHLQVNYKEMIRGALLHDYILYNWHEAKGKRKYFHGFYHPYHALRTAGRDYNLTRLEKNIILRHMFPLTPIPPKHPEAWLVSLADKICAVQEYYGSVSLRLMQAVGK